MPIINPAGEKLVEEFEGLSLDSYQDAVGVWTIGYGHTGADVHPGQTITLAQAQVYLNSDLAAAEKAVADMVEIELTPNQFSALVSFVFNVGATAFADSTMLQLLNSGDTAGAAEQFERWVHAGEATLEGLVRRRAAEKALFLTPG